MNLAGAVEANNQSPNRILIAGGGIGGLATAIALKRQSIDSLVCERAPELREVGAGLLLSPNAVYVLGCLGLPPSSIAGSRKIEVWRILDPRGRQLQQMRPTRRDGTPALSLHRGDLQLLLQAQLSPEMLRLGFTVADATAGQNGVEVVNQAGECLTGSALIGADGLNSRVRQLHCDDGAPRFCGYTGWRSVVPWIPPGYEGNWLSESWGEGKRFGISPLGGNRCYWYATANRTAVEKKEPQSTREELLSMFGHWHAPIPELIAATPVGNVTRNDIFDRRNRTLPGCGPVTLLGDAAHAMTPNLGQGACTALEDAWVLARELSSAPSPTEGLRRYEQVRRLRVRCISHASWLLGEIIQLEHPAATAIRDLMLRITPGFFGDWAMRPLFGFRG